MNVNENIPPPPQETPLPVARLNINKDTVKEILTARVDAAAEAAVAAAKEVANTHLDPIAATIVGASLDAAKEPAKEALHESTNASIDTLADIDTGTLTENSKQSTSGVGFSFLSSIRNLAFRIFGIPLEE